ncbi:glycosyltransferase [Crocosphaera sp. Alani8]|uniref:glycosyltransferase n=1 Tax=Crocosphaera sp. Alani8 TaxID=3038952 RepID=UPI00313B9AA5
MKKFLIVDHSLCNLQGHHYECSLSVAEAASRQGYEPIIIANKTFPKSLYPHHIKVISAFEVDWFDNPVTFNNNTKMLDILNLLENNLLEKLWEIGNNKVKFYLKYWELTQPKLRLLLEKVQGSLSRLFNWIIEDINLLRSIPFSNTIWGIFKIIWGLFRYILGILFKKINQVLLKLLTPKRKSFKETLSQVIKNLNLTSDDEIFIHTIGIYQVEEVYNYLASQDLSKTPRFHILLRRDIDDPLVIYAPGIGLKAIFEQCYQSKLWPNKIQFYTDTDDLIQRYNSLSEINLEKVPIPFRQEKLQPSTEKLEINKSIHFIYLGDARPEKGYHLLPNIIDSLWTDYIQPGKIKLTIQSNFNIEGGEGLIYQARLALERYPKSKVKLIKKAMSADDYYQLLAEADALILPYDTRSYRFRTSGVLTEALAAGKPVIVPQNSWLGKQVDSSRASLYKNTNEIPQKVIEVVEKLPQLLDSAKSFSQGWLEKNSPDNLVKTLISDQEILELDNTESKQAEINIDNQITSGKTFPSVPKILLCIESDFLLDREKIVPSFLNYLEYLGLCGYEIYGLFFTNKQERKFDNYELFYHRLYPVIDKIFQEISIELKQRWIIDYASPDVIPHNFSAKKYVKEVLRENNSLERDLIERYNLSIPSDLSQLLQTSQFDIILFNSILSYSIIDKFNVAESSVICEVNQILSYQYALNNHRDIDEQEYQQECQLLDKCDALIINHQYELEKIRETVNHPEMFLISAEENLDKTNYFTTMDLVFKSLLNDRALSLKVTGKKVVIFYPWGDILERKSGASKRVGLLIDYLKSQSYQVWLFTTGDAKDFREDGVRYTYYQQSHENYCLVNDIYKDAYQSWHDVLNFNNNSSETAQTSDHWLPWIYYQYRFDSGFINWVKQLTNWADSVILEYPFWGAIVGDICHQSKTQLIVTAHDILVQQIKENTLIRKIALNEEIKALKQADHLICVSQDDQAFLEEYKLTSTLIPNPVNLDDCNNKQAREDSSFNSIEKPFFLFVGSRHQPNLEAVKIIQQLATEFATQHPDFSCQFIVVGSCWEPEENNNFIALGKVSDQHLAWLYHHATLILSPIQSGTGSSLKTIEAMAYGKVLLGTSIAFRGYPVETGKEGIICDRLDEYVTLISNLLQDEKKRQEIEENARQFSKNYDYRILYSGYDDILQSVSKNKVGYIDN